MGCKVAPGIGWRDGNLWAFLGLILFLFCPVLIAGGISMSHYPSGSMRDILLPAADLDGGKFPAVLLVGGVACAAGALRAGGILSAWLVGARRIGAR